MPDSEAPHHPRTDHTFHQSANLLYDASNLGGARFSRPRFEGFPACRAAPQLSVELLSVGGVARSYLLPVNFMT